MSTVEIGALNKSFGGAAVLHDIDISIADGEFVALVGPSGCGKSTLLRIIAGLEEVTSGEVRIDGRRVNDETPKARNVAMVFQNYALYPHMTVRQNIGLNLKLAGMARTDIAERVTSAARLLDIESLLDRRPQQLSGGQRQRVAMGRAIVRQPAVFLFDEPLSNLDAKLRVQMRSEIKALHATVKTTSIYVTHDQIEAMTLADRVVVMNKGRIEQQGHPMDLYLRPDNLFVAGFIGTPAMNLLAAKIVLIGGAPHAVTAVGAHFALPTGEWSEGTEVKLGLRPEDIHLVEADDGHPVTVAMVEPMGAQAQITVRSGTETLVAIVSGDQPIFVGQAARFSVNADKVHVFGTSDGKRMTPVKP